MRNRIFVVLAIAVLAGGGLAYGTYNMVQNQPVKTVAVPTQTVVVAASNLQLGAELKAEDLQVMSFPAGKAPEGTFAQPSEVIGRGIIVPIVKNEPVLKAKLASKEAGSGLPPVIPEGMRAVSVRVDVLATANPTDQRSDTTTKVILSNVQVLTAGTRMEQDQENTKPVAVTVVTLLVFPEQSERLALASTEGKIQLALRNPLDQGAPETPGIKTAGLMGRVTAPQLKAASNGKPRPATPVTQVVAGPAPLPTVEMIRGDKRANEVIR